MSKLEPTRRSVIRAGAWSAPAVVVASAAPAVAASANRIRIQAVIEYYPGIRGVNYALALTNPSQNTVVITVTGSSTARPLGDTIRDGWTGNPPTYSRTFAPGETSTQNGLNYGYWAQTGDPANTTYSTTFLATGQGLESGTYSHSPTL